jgi:formate hydrogenlyase subunit 3/multisubunit Na+/H+ antiporter MnhD subunit
VEFLSIMAIFTQYPWLAAVIGVLLVGLGRSRARRTAIVVGVIWLLYAVYETAMRLRWLCSGECNIRVDLLLIYPLLLAATLVGIVSLLRERRPPP